MTLLKLAALDQEDLEIVSAHLQDAVMRVGDMAYLPSQKRFAAIANRFDWESAGDEGGTRKRKSFERRRSALRFDRVLDAKVQNIRLAAKEAVLELLAIQFEEEAAPEGHITLVFAGGGAIRLHVECIEAALQDLGPAWKTENVPQHGEDEGSRPET